LLGNLASILLYFRECDKNTNIRSFHKVWFSEKDVIDPKIPPFAKEGINGLFTLLYAQTLKIKKNIFKKAILS
jgi:hypothetical protein